MDLPVWCLLGAVLLLSVHADPTDQGPQKFSEPEPAALEEKPVEEKEKKQHKRQPKYEEVIMYLTPSQIKAYESGKGLMTPQQAAELRTLEESQAKEQQQQTVQYTTLGKEQLEQPQQASQFKSYEGGPRLIQSQQEVKYPNIELGQILQPPQKEAQVPHLAELDLASLNEHIKQHIQNNFNSAGQKLQKEVKKIEIQQKEKMQLHESAKNKEPKEKELPKFLPENNAQQLPRFKLQNREKHLGLPSPLQFIQQDWPHIQQQQYSAPSQQMHFEPHFITPLQAQQVQQLIPIAEHPELKHLPLHLEKAEQGPQNYAYLYFYPHGKPINNEKLQLFYPQHHEQTPKELFVQPEEHSIVNLHPKYQLVPYEYAYENKLEAEKILQTQLAEHELHPHRLEAQKLEAHQLEDFESQQFLFHKHLEPQFQGQHEASRLHAPPRLHETSHSQEHKYEPQELKLKIIPHTAALRAQASKEITVDLKSLHPLRQQEMKEIYEAQMFKMKKEKEEKEAEKLDAQLKEEEQKAEQFKAEQMKEELFINQGFRDELFKSQEFRDQLFKNQEFKNELFKSREFKQELFKNQDFKDEVFKQQEFKGQLLSNPQYNQEPIESQIFKGEMFQSPQPKDEQQFPDLGYLEKQEPKKSQMYSILSPLYQGHSIMESLQQQKNFPHHKINLETGFKPLQYAPKFNDERYAREVEKIVKRNNVEKQKALAKAAAIANEPPQVIRSEEKIIEKIIPSKPMIKHVEVPVPTPVMVPVPTPYEVKVPQPYPVPMEVIRPYPVTIVKTEKVEVPKPVPVEVVKQTPVPVPKTVYVQVEKPYFVQKMAPVEKKREIPLEIPIKLKTPIKFSIIKHTWN